MATLRNMVDERAGDVGELAAQRAVKMLDPRVDAVREHAVRQQAVTDARRALETAEREAAASYGRALKQGWTPEDMARLGFAAPERRGPGRPPRVTSSSRVQGGSGGSSGSEPGEQPGAGSDGAAEEAA